MVFLIIDYGIEYNYEHKIKRRRTIWPWSWLEQYWIFVFVCHSIHDLFPGTWVDFAQETLNWIQALKCPLANQQSKPTQFMFSGQIKCAPLFIFFSFFLTVWCTICKWDASKDYLCCFLFEMFLLQWEKRKS